MWRFAIGMLPAVSQGHCVLDSLAWAPPSLLWRCWNEIRHANPRVVGLRRSVDRFLWETPLHHLRSSDNWDSVKPIKRPFSQECFNNDVQSVTKMKRAHAHVLSWFLVRRIAAFTVVTSKWRGMQQDRVWTLLSANRQLFNFTPLFHWLAEFKEIEMLRRKKFFHQQQTSQPKLLSDVLIY